MKVELDRRRYVSIPGFVVTAKAWIVTFVVWFVLTLSCTLYTTTKISQFVGAVHQDHLMLIALETQNRTQSFDRDIELRKRLLTLQEGLTKLQDQQQSNIAKIELLQSILDRREKKEQAK